MPKSFDGQSIVNSYALIVATPRYMINLQHCNNVFIHAVRDSFCFFEIFRREDLPLPCRSENTRRAGWFLTFEFSMASCSSSFKANYVIYINLHLGFQLFRF